MIRRVVFMLFSCWEEILYGFSLCNSLSCFLFFLQKGGEGVHEVFSVIIKCIGSSLFRTVLGCSGKKYALHSREVFAIRQVMSGP